MVASDAGVRADGVADDIHITARNPLAKIREGIRKEDVHGDVTVDSDLRDLRILDAHAAHDPLLRADLAVHFFQSIPGALVEFANEIEVGIEEVTDDATEGNELWAVVAKAEVFTALFAGGSLQDGKQTMTSRAGNDGAGEDDDVIAVLLCERLAQFLESVLSVLQLEGATTVARGRHR